MTTSQVLVYSKHCTDVDAACAARPVQDADLCDAIADHKSLSVRLTYTHIHINGTICTRVSFSSVLLFDAVQSTVVTMQKPQCWA